MIKGLLFLLSEPFQCRSLAHYMPTTLSVTMPGFLRACEYWITRQTAVKTPASMKFHLQPTP